MKTTRLWIVLAVLAAVSLACNAVMGTGTTPQPAGGAGDTATLAPTDTASGNGNTPDSEYPMPDHVSNFTDLGDGLINFQTTLSLKDVMAFYRDAFGKQGYKEREILTVTTDTTFSMVFDGHASGKAIVIQGVDLGGSTNVSIRLEAVN